MAREVQVDDWWCDWAQRSKAVTYQQRTIEQVLFLIMLRREQCRDKKGEKAKKNMKLWRRFKNQFWSKLRSFNVWEENAWVNKHKNEMPSEVTKEKSQTKNVEIIHPLSQG